MSPPPAPPRKRRPKGKPRLTEAAKVRLLRRETQACGPVQFKARVVAVAQAMNSGDPRMLAGALDDVAAAAVIWGDRTRNDWRSQTK